MHTDLRLLIQHEKEITDPDWEKDYVQLFEQININIRTIKIETLAEESDLAVFDLQIDENITSIDDIDFSKDAIINSLTPLGIPASVVRFLVHLSHLFKNMFSSRDIQKASIFTDTFVAVFIPFGGGKSFNIHVTKDHRAGGRISKKIESASIDI